MASQDHAQAPDAPQQAERTPKTGARSADGAASPLAGGRVDLAPASLLALQRAGGNRAVLGLLGRRPVQRQPAPVSTPPPVSSQAPKPPDPEVMHFEGRTLRFDRTVLINVLSDIETTQGIDGRAGFVGRFKSTLVLPTGHERPGLRDDIIHGLDDAIKQLDHDHEEFTKQFEQTANQAAREILERSEATLRAEYARLGIHLTGATANIPGEPSATWHELGNKAAGAALRAAATALLPFSTAVDTTGRESGLANERLGKAQSTDPFGLQTKPLFEEAEAKRKRWMEAEETYEKQRRLKVGEQPSLAMYADEPKATEKLQHLSRMSDGELGNALADEINGRLENVAKVKPEIGKRFTVWSQKHLRRVTLDQMKATPLQREVVERKARALERAGDDEKMLFSLLAIGLGLLAALPTGGSSLLVGITAAAGLAGAGLSLYELGKQASEFSLAAAATATDIEKANAISQDDPDALGLAVAIVGAVGDIFAAAHAFKALKGIVAAAKGGDVKAALNIAHIADEVGVKGAAKQKIVGEAVAGLSEHAIEDVAKTMSSGADSTAVLGRMAGAAGHSEFGEQLERLLDLLNHVEGRIPQTAREMVASGRVRPLTEAALIEAYGATEGKRLWDSVGYAEGFYGQRKNMIFIRVGHADEDAAGFLIHEATHRVGQSNPLRGNDFLSEAIAEFAERDFYISLYHEGGPMAGKPVTSRRIQQFLTFSDEELMANIESRYFAAKKGMDPAKRMKFMNVSNLKPDDVVKQIFADIAADYSKRFPHGP